MHADVSGAIQMHRKGEQETVIFYCVTLARRHSGGTDRAAAPMHLLMV